MTRPTSTTAASDAAAELRELAGVIRRHGTCPPSALEVVAGRLEAEAAIDAQPSGVAGEWYCPLCCTTVLPVDVTYAETHVACGTTVTGNAAPIAQQDGEKFDYIDIANRAQEVTGRSIWPSTVKAVLEAALASKADGHG